MAFLKMPHLHHFPPTHLGSMSPKLMRGDTGGKKGSEKVFSCLFVVPKLNGKYRLMTDLKHLI